MTTRIVIGCNYHTKTQSNKAMRFVLDSIDGDVATLKTRKSKVTFTTHVKNLIFIESDHNIKKANRLTN